MENSITDIASLIGEPVRAKILWTLMDGRAYTARESSGTFGSLCVEVPRGVPVRVPVVAFGTPVVPLV